MAREGIITEKDTSGRVNGLSDLRRCRLKSHFLIVFIAPNLIKIPQKVCLYASSRDFI